MQPASQKGEIKKRYKVREREREWEGERVCVRERKGERGGDASGQNSTSRKQQESKGCILF